MSRLLQATKRVQVGDPQMLQQKLQKLVEGGFKELQFIIDFDYTLTRSHKNGVPVDCSWGALENYKKLGESYNKKTNELKAKYLPIELDLTIPQEKKVPLMVEWYSSANRLLSEAGVHKDWFSDMVETSSCELRDDTGTLMSTLEKEEVPVLIFSAGLGDLILAILHQFEAHHKNMKIISNFCDYDEEGFVKGLKDPMIHMFNKSENSVHDPELEQRHNVVLLGDSLGDLRMADGVKNVNVVLSVGFLNKKISENLPHYKEKYDVVLVDDQTMDFPLAVLDAIKANS